MFSFKCVVLLGLLALTSAKTSPNGEEYVSKLTPEQLRAIPEDVLEDALLDVPGLITKYGYPVETHEIETEDGYLLTMHRIPSGKNNKDKVNRIPVMLMHGLTSSSAAWVVNGPDKGLAYILADDGYDVWMGNARGNYYSRKHKTLEPEGRSFWRFTWNEIGYYDLPAMIDRILETNGNEKLHYVGHSQGGTTFFVMGSSRPDYNDKIITMQAFAPGVFLTNVRSPLVRALAKYADTLQILLTLIGQNEFFSKSEFIRNLAHEHCHEEAERFEMCLNMIYGGGNDQLNVTMIPVYMSHGPAGASSRQFIHFAQVHLSGKFRMYDFGSFGNIAKYDRLTPPNYKLNQVTARVALHHSDNDELVDVRDITQLHNELTNSLGMFRVPLAAFNHNDFITGIDAKTLLYDRAMSMMKSYE